MARSTIIFLIFLAYMIFILCYGIIATRKQAKNAKNYLAAGGNVSLGHLMMHNVGTAFGGSDFFSMCYYGFIFGIAGLHWILPWFIVTWILAKYMIPRIKAIAGDDVYSLSGWFAKAWNQNKFLEILVAIASFIMAWAFFCAQISAMGKMVNTIIGIDRRIGMVIGVIVVLSYVFVAGYGAVIKMDFIQASVLLAGVVLILGLSCFFINTMPETELITLDAHYWTLLGGMAPLAVLNMWASRGTGNGFLKPYVHQQIYAAKDTKTAQTGIMRGNIIAFVGACFLIAAGILLARFIPVASVEDPEAIIPYFLSNYVSTVPAGLILAAIFAGILSSADSLLISAINIWTESVVPLWDKKVLTDDRHRLLTAKAWVMIWGLLSVVVVFFLPSVVSLTLRGASFVVTMVPALFVTLYFREKVDIKVVIASIVAGFVTVLVFYSVPSLGSVQEGGAFPGLCMATMVMLIGAPLVKKKDPVAHFPALEELLAKKKSA